MAHSVVTPVHDMHRDLFQPIDMVENVVVVAIRLAADTKKPAIDHVVNQDPASHQNIFLIWLALAAFILLQAAGAAFPRHTGRRGLQDALALDFISAAAPQKSSPTL